MAGARSSAAPLPLTRCKLAMLAAHAFQSGSAFEQTFITVGIDDAADHDQRARRKVVLALNAL